MKKTFFVISLLFLAPFLYGQDNPVLIEINGEKITKDEFLYNYTKNNSDVKFDQASLDEYTDMFVKFKLKVADAKAEGLDTMPGLKNELKGYVDKSAEKYLSDSGATDEILREAYERKKQEVNASHILFSGEDSYEQAMKARKEIEDGADFEEVAVKYSKDPSVKENKGRLGFFTVFQMVYPFEEAAYNTPVGEVSLPIKTRFGHHLIKVNEKRTNPGKVQVAHIYTKVPAESDEKEKKNAELKIKEIYSLLISEKREFGDLAKEFSDDNSSAEKGGELAIFGSGRMVPEFETVAFGLKNNGDISEPFQTSYGWHIVKKLNHEPIGSFGEMKGELTSNIQRGDRTNKTKEYFVNKLKKEYRFKDKSSKWIKKSFNKEKIGRIEAEDEAVAFSFKKEKGLFKKKTKVEVAEFRKYLSANLPTSQQDILANFEEFTTDYFYNFEKSQLFTKYPEYKALVREFEDGILLFEISDQKVWSKASKDTLGLEAFYEKNKQNYTWQERMECEIYTCASESIAEMARKMALDTGLSATAILNEVNKDSQLNLSAKAGKFEIESPLTEFEKEKGVSEVKIVEEKYVFLRVFDILEPQNKKMKEIRGTLVSDYQKELETEWIKGLYTNHKVTINKEEIYKLKTNKK